MMKLTLFAAKKNTKEEERGDTSWEKMAKIVESPLH